MVWISVTTFPSITTYHCVLEQATLTVLHVITCSSLCVPGVVFSEWSVAISALSGRGESSYLYTLPVWWLLLGAWIPDFSLGDGWNLLLKSNLLDIKSNNLIPVHTRWRCETATHVVSCCPFLASYKGCYLYLSWISVFVLWIAPYTVFNKQQTTGCLSGCLSNIIPGLMFLHRGCGGLTPERLILLHYCQLFSC